MLIGDTGKDRHSYCAGWMRHSLRAGVNLLAVTILAQLAGMSLSFAQAYGVNPAPTLVLGDERAGGSGQHRLQLFVTSGELETYEARVQYPEGFAFAGFDALGPPNTPIGVYELDLDDDGIADTGVEIRSLDESLGYLDLFADQRFSPGLEPTLGLSDSGGQVVLGMRLPMGGDALPSTLVVPLDATATLTLFPGILVSPSAPGAYQIDAELFSVDPDTDGPSDGIEPHPLSYATSLSVEILPVESVPFTCLKIRRAKVRSRHPGRGSFDVTGVFQLDAAGDGIAPDSEEVLVEFGPFSQRIPGELFRPKRKGYVYHGHSGIHLLKLSDDGSFLITARSLDLSGLDLAEPVPFALQIGDDRGEVAIDFRPSGKYKPKGEHGQCKNN